MVQLHYLPPSEQVYHSFVPSKFDGFPIEKYFAARFNYLQEEQWAERIRAGWITLNGNKVQPGARIRERDRLVTRMGVRSEPPANRTLDVVYEDSWIRVFNKAAPIPVHPCGRYFKNSMTELLKEVYPEEVPRPVQRLDAGTTGLLVFARTRAAAAFLMVEFQENRVAKEYLALVEGTPKQDRFTVDAPIGKIKGSKRGMGEGLVRPKPARTEIECLAAVNGRSLLKVIPHSGRTNQIRVHLTSAGFPIVDDPVYGNGKGSSGMFGLHARRLRFRCFDTLFDLTAACPGHFNPFLDVVKITV